MSNSFDDMKAQKEALVKAEVDAFTRRILTPIYDTLASINDHIEVGDDGYARLGSLNDRDRLQALCDELGYQSRFQKEQS